MNTLPKYWTVKNNGSQLFKDTVIKYLNEIDPSYFKWTGLSSGYYGYEGGSKNHGTISRDTVELFIQPVVVLTLQEFIDMTTEKWIPKRGEVVLVKQFFHTRWVEKIYVTTIEGASHPIVTVSSLSEDKFRNGEPFHTMLWAEMKPKEKDVLDIKVTLNGKEISPSQISEETWKNLRNQ